MLAQADVMYTTSLAMLAISGNRVLSDGIGITNYDIHMCIYVSTTQYVSSWHFTAGCWAEGRAHMQLWLGAPLLRICILADPV